MDVKGDYTLELELSAWWILRQNTPLLVEVVWCACTGQEPIGMCVFPFPSPFPHQMETMPPFPVCFHGYKSHWTVLLPWFKGFSVVGLQGDGLSGFEAALCTECVLLVLAQLVTRHSLVECMHPPKRVSQQQSMPFAAAHETVL